MIIQKQENGRRIVTVFEPVVIYEFGDDEAYEISIAGRRKVDVEYAKQQVSMYRLRDIESRFNRDSNQSF